MKNDMEIDSGNYYKKRQIKIIKEMSPFLESIKDDLVLEVGEDEANRLFEVFYRTWDSMIHEIPYIGGDKNRFTWNLERTVPRIVMWKVLKAEGWSIEQFAPIFLKGTRNYVKQQYSGIKRFAIRLLMKYIVNKWTIKKMIKKQKKLSEKYPENFVIKYVECDGEEYDYGYDIHKCPIVEFGKSQDAEEILPYICLIDWYKAYYSKSGLIRSKTLSEGCEYCDYRFKKGSPPRNLQKTQIPDGLKPWE